MLATALTGAFASTAGAAPQPSKEQQAAELENQIEASDLQISALAEKLDAAIAKQAGAQQTVNDAEAQIAVAKAEVKRISALVEENLASLYRRTLRGETGASFFSGDWNDLLRRGKYANASNSRDDNMLERLNAAQQDLAATRSEAAQARDTAAAEGAQIAAAKAAVEAARASQQGVLDQVKGEIAVAVAAEQARRAAAAVSRRSPSGGGLSHSPTSVLRTGARRRQSPTRARSLERHIRRAPRMGPSYDCSGLVFKAWEAAGVGIPSTSGSMYGGCRTSRWTRSSPATSSSGVTEAAATLPCTSVAGRSSTQAPPAACRSGGSGAAQWEPLGSSDPCFLGLPALRNSP